MELNIRRLRESDWDLLVQWWSWWKWPNLPKEYLPDNGVGGLMVEKNNMPIVAGFIYFTNSKGALLEWIVSNPKYKEKDRQQAIELLIIGAEKVCKAQGIKYMFTIGRNKHLIETHKKLNWSVDSASSYEIVKII
jgi:hypothetical protein